MARDRQLRLELGQGEAVALGGAVDENVEELADALAGDEDPGRAPADDDAVGVGDRLQAEQPVAGLPDTRNVVFHGRRRLSDRGSARSASFYDMRAK